MTAFEIVCPSDPRAPWLAARRSGIGSSDAPALLGLSPWASPLSVYADKIAETAENDEATEAQRWGQILEPVILREFARETGRTVGPAGQLLRSTVRPWQIATLDGEQQAEGRDGTGIVEVKATGFRSGDWTDGVPDHVQAQVQHQFSVTGYCWASIVVLLRGCQLRWVDVERDENLIARIVEAEAEFWRRVEAREPVDPDGSEATRAALKALYPKDNGETVALPGELIELDADLVVTKERIKSDEARKDAIENRIRAAIGPATEGVLANGVRWTHRLQERKEFTMKASEFRVLRRSKK